MNSATSSSAEPREWQRRWPIVGDVAAWRNASDRVGAVAKKQKRGHRRDQQITHHCYEHGLITITAGTYSNVIRVLVPLVATKEQIDEGLDVLESALANVCDKKGAVAQLV